MIGSTYNPVIGYMLVDKEGRVLSPPGEKKDVAYHSVKRAQEAALGYGYEEKVGQIVPLYLGGILSVVWDDVGDIFLDGKAALGLSRACKRLGINLDLAVKKQVKWQEAEPIYSSRAIVGHKPTGQGW
jgi:hypothetical protein